MKPIIKDKYLKKRGGTAKIINVSCAKCGTKLFIYQKDGPGWLKRCYINRILKTYPGQPENDGTDDLICHNCNNLIGTPMIHKDNRNAIRLKRGEFKRTNNKSYGNK